jgi:hypothetical protein
MGLRRPIGEAPCDAGLDRRASARHDPSDRRGRRFFRRRGYVGSGFSRLRSADCRHLILTRLIDRSSGLRLIGYWLLAIGYWRLAIGIGDWDWRLGLALALAQAESTYPDLEKGNQ